MRGVRCAKEMEPQIINNAIASFQQWERPWEFYDAVFAKLISHKENQQTFENVWLEATNEKYWTNGDLGECCEHAKSELNRVFPFLTTNACSAVANAAAYEWK
jgi:hypothetical protein